jgi:hypothetical protein
VLAAHVAAMLGVSRRTAGERLSALRSAGLLSARHGPYRNDCHQITTPGLRLITTRLPRPRFDIATYWHDVGIAWLWLAARRGAFGPLTDVVSERHMRSSDGADPPAEPFGVRLGGYGAGGRARLHYPDLLLCTDGGHRIAIELERSGKERARRDSILSGYAVDRRIDAVVYLVDDPAVARAVSASARRLGLESLIHVQRFEWDPAVRPGGRSRTARTAERPAERGGRQRGGDRGGAER